MKKRKFKQKQQKQSAGDLRQNGWRAFQSGNYMAALQTWERIPATLADTRLAAAKAEACFRLSCAQTDTPEDRYQSIQKATTLQPQNRLYQYHLGLAAYQAGHYAEALSAYENAWRSDELARRVALPLLLTLHHLKRNPTTHPAWGQLTPQEQSWMQKIVTPASSKGTTSPVEATPLGQGLVALQQEKWSDAAAFLHQASQNSPQDPLIHYALGLVAAQQENWAEAVKQWQQAHQGGITHQRLQHNLGETAQRLAEERLVAGDILGAHAAAQQATFFNHDTTLADLNSHIALHLGYQAAQQGNYQQAHHYWETVANESGRSFRLAYNLALLYEKNDDPIMAAEQWREVLRRRPRKADHPDALNEVQVSRLYQRAAEAYNKVQAFDEAIQVYKHAVKRQPDNLELRLELVDSLFENGQIEAALNEVERILSRNAQHIPTLLKAGEIHAQTGPNLRYNPAIQYWEKVLTLEPNHTQARQYLADFFQDEVEQNLLWLGPARALLLLEKALGYQPDNGVILVKMADMQFEMEQDAAAEATIQRVLALPNIPLTVYEHLISTFVSSGQIDRFREIVPKAEKLLTYPKHFFYVTIGMTCLSASLEPLAREWFEKAIPVTPPDVPALIMISEGILKLNNPLARTVARDYLQRAIAANQYPGQAHLMLGIAAAQENDLKAAKKAWALARQQARRTQDQPLLERIQRAEIIWGGSMPFMRGLPPGLPPLPPELMNMFAQMFNEEFDEF